MQWVEGSGVATPAPQVASVSWIQSLAQELPDASGAAIKKRKEKKPAVTNLVNSSARMESKYEKKKKNTHIHTHMQ